MEVTALDDKLRNTTYLLSDRDSHWSGAQQEDWLGTSDSRLSLLSESWDSKCMPLGLDFMWIQGNKLRSSCQQGKCFSEPSLQPTSIFSISSRFCREAESSLLCCWGGVVLGGLLLLLICFGDR